MDKVILFSISVLFFSCMGTEKRPEAQTTGPEVILPDSVEIYNPNIGDGLPAPFAEKTDYKIYASIDVSCATCLRQLVYWTDFKLQKIAGRPVAIIPVCGAADRFEALKFMFESNKLPGVKIPLILDIHNQFPKLNAGLFGTTSERVFLTDSTGRLILKGNPMLDKTVEEKFIKLLTKPAS